MWIADWVPGGRELRRIEDGQVVEVWTRRGDWFWHRVGEGEAKLVRPGNVPVVVFDRLREAA